MLLDRAAELVLPEEAGLTGACLHQLFERRVEAEPSATALIDGEHRISYRELERQANRWAHRLRELGAGPEVRVAVCLERTADLVVALLAVLKAGSAYVPIDPSYPPDRQGVLLTDSGAAILITRERLLPGLPATAARAVCIDRDREELARRSESRLATAAGPSNLAYLIYTSGSTGRPKAVAIEHRSAVALLEWSARTYRREELAGVLAATSVCFDLSVFEIFATLAVGGALILAENALALPSLPAAAEVTLVNTVPSAAAELAASGGIPPSVRVVNLAGEPLRAALVERLYRLDHVEAVYNLYGPSEDTTYSTWARMRRGDPLPPSIGVPVDGTYVHLLDREMRPAGPGEEGELYLGGAGLARGYLGRPDLTAQRFVPDPFGSSPGERLYATGDLARFRPSGELDYLGRIDHQVKIRGFRIELGEIEAALDRTPGVAGNVVVAREIAAGDTLDKILVAYVVPSPGATLDAASLRAHLEASLPAAMVPSRFAVLAELPLQPNGKVDRRALPAPEPAADPERHLPPRTPLEEALAGIWSEVLGLERVGIDDDFFVLGGHSLLATRVLSRVRRTLGVELPQRVLFEHPTIAGLARAVMDAGAETSGGVPALEAAPRDGRGLPLSFAQGRLWLLDRLEPGSPVYNEPLPLALSGALDRGALEAALDGIVRRHEVLRTRFAEVAGQPVQIVEPAAPFVLPLVDLTALAGPRRQAEAARLGSLEATAPFDLALPRMLRARLLRLEEGEHHLLLTFHHIAIDGWSFGILLRELSLLYAACASGEPAVLPEMPFQYADFAVWQRRWLGGELEGQLAYWRQRLAGVPELLDLPADRPRPAARSLRGDLLDLDLPAELTRSLGRLAGREGATLFMVLLAAFEALLFRLTGQESFLVGSPIANRNRQETEGLIGFFVNSLALRADLAGGPDFRELLRRTREVTLEAYAHQDLPFDRLVEELHPERSLSHTPLFQVMLVVQNAPEGALELPGIAARSLPAGSHTAKLDLTVIFEQRPGGLGAFLEYATDLFDAPTAARLARHFETLLAGVAARPEARVDELPLLTPGETQQLLLEWNDVRTDFPREACLHELVEEWAERTPEAVAVVCGELSLTWRELSERAGRLAHHLRGCGVGPDVRVAVLMERSAELVVALLAVLKAGGAFVPLDPGTPRERLEILLEEAQASVLISGPGLQVKGRGRQDGGAPSEAPRVLPDHLAYVMFTSGTTGRPKGVAVPHRAVVRLVRETRFARFGPGEVLLLLAPASFDASTLEIWGALANGGRLVVYPGERAGLEELGEVLERHRVSTLWLTAGLFHQMVERNLQGLRPVRQLLAGGDVLSPRHVRAALQGLPGCTVINGYGPTENTTFTCCHPMSDAAAVKEPVPIGRPIANSHAVVVDRAFRPVPVGVPGELLAGGDGLARGYLERPDLTAERFVPDPTAGILGSPGDRVYRTGDLVRLLPDGCFEFLGRIDQQVKVRGFRIEPGEIETALGEHPAVAAAVVVARPVREGVAPDRRLVGYVVLRPGPAAPGTADLRSFLRERLPEPMVPTAWVFLDELPLTPRGKVDRRALPEPGAARPEEAVELAPRTPTEEVLAGIWSEVLGVETVGVHGHFFDLGGHSLLATQAVSRVRETFDAELPLRRLFERPTLSGFAEAVDEALRGKSGVAVPGVEPAPRTGPMPLAFAQRRLWFLDQLAPGSPVYNVPFPLRLAGSLDAAALQRALSEVARRHEALRTTFAATAGEPRQVIAPPQPVPLPQVDLAGLPEEARRAEALRLLRDDARAPFDLAAGPLLRATLLRLAAEEHELLLTLHHIVADGWSMEILLRELASLYQGAALPELPVQAADFAVWQQRWLAGETRAAQLDYWRSQLAGVPPPPELPADHARPAVQSHRGALLTVPLPPDLAAGLRVLCRREGVTLFMAALAGLDTLLLRTTGQEDLTVGSVVANRNRAETEGLIGFFVNTLVLRTSLAGDPAFRALLGRVRETALAAYGHQDVPFETLVEDLHPERDLARTPFFEILIHHIRRGAARLEMASGLHAERLPADTGTAKFDLSLTVVDSAEALELHLEYATDLFDATTILRVFGHLTRLLAAAAARPDLPLSLLPLLGPEEAAQILVDWNDTARDFGPRGLVHEQVAAQARQQPDALAVAAGARRLTYGELVARAWRLAHHLQSLGVGAGTRVAVLMERTPERVAGILAVLAAGGAYVSLDPAHPRERLAFQIADAAAPVVLTQRDLAARLPAADAEVLILDGGWSGFQGREDAAPEVRIEPENLAYVVYTSGSTGTPKGVEIPHAGLANLVAWHREEYAVTAADRATLVANPAFDASVWEVWPYLTAGASLHIPEEEVRLAPAALSRWWAEERITLSFLPTPLAEAVLEEELPVDLALRALIVGGDRLRRGPVPGAAFRLMNHYGPSESSVVSTMGPVAEEGIPSIGRPIANTRVYVLDAAGAPVPVGVPGELWVAGDGLARGYVGRPDLTAERFLPDPRGSGARMYRTGDRVRWRRQGDLDFLGRLDHQVKIRGLRIELGEIEAALLRLPAVREAVVLARPAREDASGGLRLVAWIVPAAGEAPAPGELRRDLLLSLPEYMVPAAFVRLTELPLTPNGKLDRKALPDPEPDPAGLGGSFVAPRGPVEELVAGIWCEVLGRDRVGADDPFFELGGHSLLAIQVVARLRNAFGVDLPVRALFEAATVSRLAERIAAARSGPAGIEAPALRPMARENREAHETGLPLSFAQGRLWLLDRLAPGTAIFNVPQPLAVGGPLDPPVLAAALTEIVRRHEVLRTVFREQDGEALQVIRPAAPVALPVADLAGLPAAAREAEARRLAGLEARLPFDLAAGPLTRTALLRLAPEEHVLLLTIHHIVTDGWSMAVFTRELRELYAAFTAGRPSPLPELPLQYADFALWQRRFLDGGATAALVARWRDRFGTELPVLRLPTDRPRPAVQTSPGAWLTRELPPELSAEIRSLSRRSGTTLFMTLLAAFQALLARLTGQERIVVGTPVAGRDRAEIEGLIGFFVNSLVLPADLTGDPTFAEILGRVRDMALDAYACQELPFEKLVEALQPERDRSRSPLFQVMFALESEAGPAAGETPLALTPFPVETGTSQFDLTLYMTETPGSLSAVAEYNTDLFDAATIEKLLENYRRLLAAAVADPGTHLSALPPALEAAPRPTPAPSPARRAANDPAERRARLLERRGQLSEEQQRQLEQRLRGASPAPAAASAPPPPVRCLVEITPAAAGVRPPFFCVHPAGGDVLCFFPLARHLGSDQPFFGFQARGLEDGAEPFATLEEMAAHYISELRRVQPAGPYRLGGWSFGGLAAYEMARQLAEQGEEVALLAVLDTAPGVLPEEPEDPTVSADGDTPWLLVIADYVRGLRGADLGVTAEQLAPLAPEERLRTFVDRLRAAGIVHAGEDGLAQLRRLLRVFKTNARAFRSYRPRPYPGPITLFRAAGSSFDPSLGPDLGWSRLTPTPVEIHELSGDHLTMMAEPEVARLAERLRGCLER